MNSQLPSFAALRPVGLTAAATAGVGGGVRPPHISIDSNAFTLVDGTGNRKPLPPLIFTNGSGQQEAKTAIDVVFIDANPHPSKIYWDPAKPYSPNSVDPPLCWSDNGIAPSTQALEPQSSTCAPCPHNAIGSAISKFSGAAIKACRDSKKLAAIIPGDADGMIYLMNIPPASFKNWTTCTNWLKQQKTPQGGAPELFDVVIRMSFESQGVLKFEPVALIDAAVQQQIANAWAKQVTKEIVGATDQPIRGQIAAPQQAGPAQAYGQLAPPPPPAFQPMQATSPAQTAYMAPPAPVVETGPLQMFHTGQPAQMYPPQPAGAPPKRRRRTKAEIEADNLARGSAPPAAAPAFVSGLQQVPSQGAPMQSEVQGDIPPFLRRLNTDNSGQSAPVRPAATPQQQAGQFGLQTPQEPGNDLKAKLAAAFNLPTGK